MGGWQIFDPFSCMYLHAWTIRYQSDWSDFITKERENGVWTKKTILTLTLLTSSAACWPRFLPSEEKFAVMGWLEERGEEDEVDSIQPSNCPYTGLESYKRCPRSKEVGSVP